MDRNLIVYKGEIYQIIGQAIAQHNFDDGSFDLVPVIHIEKVECSFHPKWKHQQWIKLAEAWAFPSQLDWTVSHWTLGVENGLRNASQDYED